MPGCERCEAVEIADYGIAAERRYGLILQGDDQEAGKLRLLSFARHIAEGRDDEFVALHQQPVRLVQGIADQPRLEFAVLEAPDGIGGRIRDVDRPRLVGGDVVQEQRAFRRVAIDDLPRGDVDLHQLIDVGDIERAVMQRETGRAVESLDPFPRDDGAVGPELGDESVAVLLHDGAGNIADIEEASGRVLHHRFRLGQALDLPHQLRLGRRGAGQDQT